MMKRYQLFAQQNVRDLKGYNEKIAQMTEEGAPKKLPKIVIIVDELADLMMVAPGEVEGAICRLAQLARAAGLHLIIATQRPSVNVITGLIKANMPSRIAFSVSSGVDSRTIIDMNGAEKLLGKGDMLFYPTGYPKPVRVQGSFVSDKEVQKVVDYLIEHNGNASYSEEVEEHVNSDLPSPVPGIQGAGVQDNANEQDAYFADAGRLIIEKEKASIGMLQRMFKIGFNRAARIMDQLASAGVVGEEVGTKPKKSTDEQKKNLNSTFRKIYNAVEEEMMKTDIQIAQEAELMHIKDVAASIGISEEELEFYGKYKAKLSDELWENVKDRKDGKLVLVTAINPTPAGEGKTTITVGLGEAFAKMNKKDNHRTA